MSIGAVEILPLYDAVGELAELAETYPDVPAVEWDPFRAIYPELFAGTRWRLPVKVYLLRSEATTVLVDTGIGPPGLWGDWTPEREGLLPASLEANGVRREDVDVVFLTHLHVDHLGWNTDADAEVFFPEARYVVHRDALAFARARPNRPHIVRCVEPLVERFELLRRDAELAPSISAFTAPGHYPGHMGVRIRAGGEEAVLIADVAPHPALLDQPGWVFAFDVDPQENAPTRAALIDELVDGDALVVCGHYPGNGIGRAVTRDGRVVWEAL